MLFIAVVCSISNHPYTAASSASAASAPSLTSAVVSAHASARVLHSRFTPDWGAAHYWTSRYFGKGTWQQRLMMCVAYHESRYELAATNWPNVGPWQVNLTAHPWVNGTRIRWSWKYAAAVSWHLSGRGTDFHAWTPDCGIS